MGKSQPEGRGRALAETVSCKARLFQRTGILPRASVRLAHQSNRDSGLIKRIRFIESPIYASKVAAFSTWILTREGGGLAECLGSQHGFADRSGQSKKNLRLPNC